MPTPIPPFRDELRPDQGCAEDIALVFDAGAIDGVDIDVEGDVDVGNDDGVDVDDLVDVDVDVDGEDDDVVDVDCEPPKFQSVGAESPGSLLPTAKSGVV